MLDLKRVLASAPKEHVKGEAKPLFTPWGESLNAENVLSEHPRPQFARKRFEVLNGWWDYAIVRVDDARGSWRNALPPREFEGRILVPFTPKTLLSGVDRQVMPEDLLWYRRRFAAPSLDKDERCVLHFQAVDWACACYVNGAKVGEHVGGYLPFSFDITDALREGCALGERDASSLVSPDEGDAEIWLCVFDPSDCGTQLRGKQKIGGTGIWYEAQAGIWQTVWYEIVPQAHIEAVRIDADAQGNLTVSMDVSDDGSRDFSVYLLDETEWPVTFEYGSELISPVDCAGMRDQGLRATRTSFHHVSDVRVWDLDDPYLYRLRLTYGDDVVYSYCGFRSVSVEQDERGCARFFLNGKPLFLKGVLDQGYWSDGLMTAPADEALVFDIESMKAAGFNMLRKHIKVESERWYYHCDRLGMLVWQDMVSGGGSYGAWQTSYKPTMLRWSWGHFDDSRAEKYEKLAAGDASYRREWEETCLGTVEHLRDHPSVVGWTLFNEAWGQFEARRMTALVRSIDARPIDAVSGWYDQRCGDFLSVHNYFRDLEVWPDRAKPEQVRDAVNRMGKRAFSLSEFGGLTYAVDGHALYEGSYGYASFGSLELWKEGVLENLAQAEGLWDRGLSVLVYTQLSDVEEEVNGILTADRRVNKLTGEGLSGNDA